MLFSTSITSTKSNSSALEKKFKSVIEKAEGIGDISVMISTNTEKQVEGVIIVAQGAENATIKKTIYDAAIAVLGVKPNKVEIFAQKK